MVSLKHRLNLNKKINSRLKLKNNKSRTNSHSLKTNSKNKLNSKSNRINRMRKNSTNNKILVSKIVWIKY